MADKGKPTRWSQAIPSASRGAVDSCSTSRIGSTTPARLGSVVPSSSENSGRWLRGPARAPGSRPTSSHGAIASRYSATPVPISPKRLRSASDSRFTTASMPSVCSHVVAKTAVRRAITSRAAPASRRARLPASATAEARSPAEAKSAQRTVRPSAAPRTDPPARPRSGSGPGGNGLSVTIDADVLVPGSDERPQRLQGDLLGRSSRTIGRSRSRIGLSISTILVPASSSRS